MSSLTVKLVWENVKRSSIMLAAACWGHLDALKQWKEQSGKQKGLVFEKNIGYFAASGVAWKSSNMHTGTNCLGMNGHVRLRPEVVTWTC